MKNQRLYLGLLLFIATTAFVLVNFNTNVSALTLLWIAAASFLMIPCKIALQPYNDVFTAKRKLLLLLPILGCATMLKFAFPASVFLGDIFFILLFACIVILANTAFSSWQKTNISLLPHLGFSLANITMLLLSFTLITEMEEGHPAPIIGIAFPLIAYIPEHFWLLKNKKLSTSKCIVLSILLSLTLLLGLFVLIVAKSLTLPD